jgi:phage regulator Rha-like protein
LQIETLEKSSNSLRFQNETSNNAQPLRLQNEILNTRGRHSKYLPYVFTEQGVAMLSGVLRSKKAIDMNIAIMRAFVEVRRILLQQSDLREQIREIRDRLGEHDVQLNHIYDAMENLLDEKAGQRKWDERERIGFKKR